MMTWGKSLGLSDGTCRLADGLLSLIELAKKAPSGCGAENATPTVKLAVDPRKLQGNKRDQNSISQSLLSQSPNPFPEVDG